MKKLIILAAFALAGLGCGGDDFNKSELQSCSACYKDCPRAMPGCRLACVGCTN